jgi:putative MFS transporter
MEQVGVPAEALQGPHAAAIEFEDAPLRPFHLLVAFGSSGGVFTDGFGLGIVGISLSAATTQLHLTPLWLGLLGAGSLAGLFVGALLTGLAADRWGRRPIYAFNMAVLALLSGLQLLVESPAQWLVLRVAIGLVLGTDYVVSKTLLTEFTPRRLRGPLLSTVAVAWAAGYVFAYFVGYVLAGSGPNAWRWMLVICALPALCVLPVRLMVPESPLWLANHGRIAQAARIVHRHIGPEVMPPAATPSESSSGWRWRQLLSPAWRQRTFIGCTFYTCQVIPYFALGTFVADVMSALHVAGNYSGALVYNLFLLVGAGLGTFVIDRMSRRAFLLGTFAVTATAMLGMTIWTGMPAVTVLVLFAVFACVLSASQNLVSVYLPELFPTQLRASGIGMAIAASRLGSAASTFLLPIVVAGFGIRAALGACVATLIFGGVVCLFWAPETKNRRLGAPITVQP